MASVVTLPFQLTAPPAEWSKPSTTGKISGKCSSVSPVKRTLYAAGPSYISAARRQLLNRTFEQDDEATHEHRETQAAKAQAEKGEELYPGLGEEVEDPALLRMDAKEWKKQDHYAVLGLGDYRYTATEDQIRVAHRRKVLRHHPDKKASGSTGTNDDSFFKCIQKAFETLLNPETRRQFDSVDRAIEDFVPNAKTVKPEEYCDVYGPIFAREARFSKKQPVPSFGAMDATKQEVEAFYDFWYNFDSWRSFEALDKEVNEGSDSRDEKRYMEKKNKAERARLKKEDNTRLREMVDMVLASDPRIKRFRAEEKAARDAKKGAAAGGKGKPLTLAQKKAEAAKKAEEEKKAAEEAKAKEADEKVQREAAKKARDAAKKNLKKWKKAVTNVVSESNYFQPQGTTPSASTVEKQLTELDTLFELLEVEESRELKDVVEKAGKGDVARDAIKAKASVAAGRGGQFEEFA